MTSLSLDEMKAFVRRHLDEFVDQGDPAAIRRSTTPGFLDHDGPGIRVAVEDLVAENDRVACRNAWRWRDPASGRAMEFHGFVLWRFEGDRAAERWATVASPAEVAA